MTKKEILEYLECIDDALTDAYNTAHEGEINSDSIYYMDTAKDRMGNQRLPDKDWIIPRPTRPPAHSTKERKENASGGLAGMLGE